MFEKIADMAVLEVYRITLLSNQEQAVEMAKFVLEVYRITLLSNRCYVNILHG